MVQVEQITDTSASGNPKWDRKTTHIQYFVTDSEVYVGGNTSPYKDLIKENGGKWAGLTHRYAMDHESFYELQAKLNDTEEAELSGKQELDLLLGDYRVEKSVRTYFISLIATTDIKPFVDKAIEIAKANKRKTITQQDVDQAERSSPIGGLAAVLKLIEGLDGNELVSVQSVRDVLGIV